MNGQAGTEPAQTLQHGRRRGPVTYWLTHKWGIAGDYRGGAGTTPVLPNRSITGRW